MKHNRTYIFIGISSIALLCLLLIQVNWIFRTAKIKEELFTEKANMVLAKTSEALSADNEMCRNIEACVDVENETKPISTLGTKEKNKLDSLFKTYMAYYNIQIEYSFVVSKPDFFIADKSSGFAKSIYNRHVDDPISADGLELKLIFPEKKKYVLAEMGPMFITSVVLILFIFILFWRTTLSLLREKKISARTADFLNNMTHEFKTPLTNIALAGKMITRESNIQHEEKIRQYARIIIDENEKLQLQVEQVLHMNALEQDAIPIHQIKLDFHALIHEVVQNWQTQFENKHVHIELDLLAKEAVVNGNKIQLSNVLNNLIDNALKYSKDIPFISIHTHNENKQLVIQVTDHGIGISSSHLAKVFEKFFRVPTGDVHDAKGFGLGLTYSKKTLELHGGTLLLQSEINKGSTFTLHLPNAK